MSITMTLHIQGNTLSVLGSDNDLVTAKSEEKAVFDKIISALGGIEGIRAGVPTATVPTDTKSDNCCCCNDIERYHNCDICPDNDNNDNDWDDNDWDDNDWDDNDNDWNETDDTEEKSSGKNGEIPQDADEIANAVTEEIMEKLFGKSIMDKYNEHEKRAARGEKVGDIKLTDEEKKRFKKGATAAFSAMLLDGLFGEKLS